MARWMRMFRRTPARPPAGEVAGSRINNLLAPYIGELPMHPQEEARYAWDRTDETTALTLYRNVLRDERCKSALNQRLDAAIAVSWQVEAGGDAPVDREAADHLAEQLEAIEFDRFCRQLLHGVWYGWSVAECMWGRRDDRVVLDHVKVRSLDRFWWGTDGELLLRTWTTPLGERVPAGKFIVLAQPGEHDDLPWQPGLARWCFWPVWLKRHGIQFWSIALEKFGAPTAVGTYPPGASEEEKSRLLELVASLATGVGITLPEGQKVELLATAQRVGGSGGGDYKQFVEYLEHAITTTILGQSSTTDQGPWRGTAEVQKDVRDETVAADVRLLDSVLNRSIARWLTAWNFPTAATPKIRHDADPPEDLDRRARREKAVAATTGLRPTPQHVADVYGGEWEQKPMPAALQPGADPDEGGTEPGAGEEEDDDPQLGTTDPPPGPPARRATPAAAVTLRWRQRRRTVRSRR